MPSPIRSNMGQILMGFFAVALMAGSAFAIYYFNFRVVPRKIKISPVYFYDLANKQLFTEESNVVPPIPSPSDASQQAVRAYVYTWGSCGDSATTFIGYLEKFNDKGKAAMIENLRRDPDAERKDLEDALISGRFISSRDADHWVNPMSTTGMAVLNTIGEKCNAAGHAKDQKECFPSK